MGKDIRVYDRTLHGQVFSFFCFFALIAFGVFFFRRIEVCEGFGPALKFPQLFVEFFSTNGSSMYILVCDTPWCHF